MTRQIENWETKVQQLIAAVGEIYDALESNAAPFEPAYALRNPQEAVTLDPELLALLLEAYLPLR